MHVKQAEFITALIAKKHSRKSWYARPIWEVHEPLIFNSKYLQLTIVVPAGFCTDFASIPWLILTTFLFGNRGHAGATVHDYLYKFGRVGNIPISRQDADKVLAEAVQVAPDLEPYVIAMALWSGVSIGGIIPWRKYRSVVIPNKLYTFTNLRRSRYQ